MTYPTATPGGSATTGIRRRFQRLGLTTRPESFAEQFCNSSAVWLALMAFWAIADILLTIFPNTSGRQLPPDGWLTHLAFTLIGLAAAWCMHRTGFPAAWDEHISARRRLLLPLVVGAIFGALAIGMELYFGTLRDMQVATGTKVTVAFPQSLLAYASGAIYLEFFFLVAPVSLLLWLISGVILRGRAQAPTFWVLAVLSSSIEPAFQGPAVLTAVEGAIGPLAFGLYVLHSFGFNFGAAALFRRYGLLAPVLVRLGNYMVWHVLFGNLFL